MLFSAAAIGMLPYLKMNMISSVPNISASSLARRMTWSGVPQGCELKKPRRKGVGSALSAFCMMP